MKIIVALAKKKQNQRIDRVSLCFVTRETGLKKVLRSSTKYET